MPFRIGPLELIILFTLVLIIFGVGRLPEIGSAAGRAIKDFRKGVSGENEEQPQAALTSKSGDPLVK